MMTKLKGMGLALGLLAAAVLALGATGPTPTDPTLTSVRGVVLDATTGVPLGGAEVFIEGTVMGTRTDGRGRFELELGDTYAGQEVGVRVRLVGYLPTTLTVAIPETGSAFVEITLGPDTPLGDERDDEPQPLEEKVAGDRLRAEAQVRQMVGVTAGASNAPHSVVAYPPPGRYDPEFNREGYAHIEENGWKLPVQAPLSTFSIDVDRASYSNVRRFIRNGDRPPIDAVRIEEMINYFSYDQPDVRSEHPFAIDTEVARAPWNRDHHLVRIAVQGERVDLQDLPPSNLVFLLDVSGSMHSPDKLPLLKKSLRLLVNELRPEDRVAIVVYAGAAGLVLPSTSGEEKGRIRDAIEGLEAGGSTAGGAGIRLAYRVARDHLIEGGNNRVILATDGDFNVGPSSDAEMTRLIEEKREEGTFLTVLGFGQGNLQDSKMEALADHGNGNYAYIDGLLEARKVLVSEMGGTLLTIAKDVKIQVEFNPTRVQAYRLIGYENRLLAAEDFNDDTKDAGELGAGHTVTALYEVVPTGAPAVSTSSVDPLRYGGSESTTEPEASVTDETSELLFVKLRYKRPDGDRSRLIEVPVEDEVTRASENLRFAAAVAAFGMQLRDSEHRGDFSLRDVVELAQSAMGEDEHGYRSEFVQLVRTTQTLGLLVEDDQD